MKLGGALGILICTSLAVGFLSCSGGALLMLSSAYDVFAGMADVWADLFYDLGDPDEAWETRNDAIEFRDSAREFHDYGIYCLVGALLSLVGGASLLAWRWRKK